MQFTLPTPSLRPLAATALLALFASVPAQAAITLTIDTVAQTFTWSGTATSEVFAVAPGGTKTIRLGNNTWIGGISVGYDGEGSLDASLTPGGVNFRLFSASDAGVPAVSHMHNAIYIDLGIVEFNPIVPEAPTSTALSITGDGQAYAYVLSAPEGLAFFESLDGTELFFQDFQGGPGVFNIGSAGHVVVIPEPSSALLLLAAPFICLRRRRGKVA